MAEKDEGKWFEDIYKLIAIVGLIILTLSIVLIPAEQAMAFKVFGLFEKVMAMTRGVVIIAAILLIVVVFYAYAKKHGGETN